MRAGDNWHLDEVLLKINVKRQWLWRAVIVDQGSLGELLERCAEMQRLWASAST